jgi:Flp pilus assembly protein TadG
LRGGAVHRFAAASNGMAATEFAILTPVLIVMLVGVTELTDAYDANTRTTAVASTAADLMAQEKIVCDAERDDAFAALYAIMYPYPTTNMDIVISSLIDNGNDTVKVAWSDATPGATARTVNSAVTIPPGLVPAGESVIMAEVTYTYSSPMGFFFPEPFDMTDTYYLHPRKTDQIEREASC